MGLEIQNLFLCLAIALGVSATALSASPSTAQIPSRSGTTSVAQQLLGTWQLQLSPQFTIQLIFTSGNKLFVLHLLKSEIDATEYDYRINPQPHPMHMDWFAPGDQRPLMGIFNFSKDGRLQLPLLFTVDSPRPTALDADDFLYRKVSSSTMLPAKVKITDALYPKNLPAQFKATKQVQDINLFQQRQYLDKQKFAGSIRDFGSPINNSPFHYKIEILNDSPPKAMVTAQAQQPGFKSLTGIVFVLVVQGKKGTIAGICETNRNNSPPPSTPVLMTDPRGLPAIQCPAGSHPMSIEVKTI